VSGPTGSFPAAQPNSPFAYVVTDANGYATAPTFTAIGAAGVYTVKAHSLFDAGVPAAQRAERMLRVQEALNGLDPIDREVLALRHFRTARPRRGGPGPRDHAGDGGERYFRALKRLKDALATLPGSWEGH
jgi:hypothetical protein